MPTNFEHLIFKHPKLKPLNSSTESLVANLPSLVLILPLPVIAVWEKGTRVLIFVASIINENIVVSEWRAPFCTTVYQVILLLRHHFLFPVKLYQKSFISISSDVLFANLVPFVVSKSTNSFSMFCQNQSESVFSMIALIVETSWAELILWGSKQ